MIQEMVLTLMGKAGTPEIQKIMSQVSRLIVAGELNFYVDQIHFKNHIIL